MEPTDTPTPEPVAPSPAPAATREPASPARKLRPLIVIFACFIAFGAYVVINGQGGKRLAVDPLSPEAAARQALITTQQHYLLKHYGGESSNAAHKALVARIGQALATKSEAKDTDKVFRFHVLAELNRINAFALPDGDIYVTTALVNRMRTEGELAAALSNGVAHAVMGHRMEASPALTEKTDPKTEIALHFTAEQESAVDAHALKIMADAGYNPESMLSLFRVLTDAYTRHADVPFFATHPSTDWRLTDVANAIKAMYPKGIPAVLSK